jgi:hypothetical protein
VNKAVTGDPKLVRLVLDHLPRADESAAERQQNSPDKPDRKPVDMTNEELLMVIQGIHPEYSITKCPNLFELPKID